MNLGREEVDSGRRIRNYFGYRNKRKGGHFHNLIPLSIPHPPTEGGVV